MILGIDIGTTNIEYCVDGSFEESIVIENPLKKYGLDVMTRINHANNGKLSEMSSCLRDTLAQCVACAVDLRCDASDVLQEIRIAANTTMVHILMNYDCTNLGSFPFSPVHIEPICVSAKELGIDIEVPVYITPGMSAFVGGDIVSGLSTLSVKDNLLFVDLGTNAEMVAVYSGKTYITSAAAGPAFETCARGYASVAIDGMVAMLESGVMDETGLLSDEFFDNGYDSRGIHFSQKKIRDFQMAKSAIRTGIELLCKMINMVDKQKVRVHIAGTFGNNLNIDNAIRLGMFPEWFKGQTVVVGNTSLQGTFINKECKTANWDFEEIVLANHPDFNDCYISNMNF